MTTSYEIRIAGDLDSAWSEWLYGMAVLPLPNGETLFSGPLADQAALHGLLARIRDLNLTLLSLERVNAGSSEKEGA